MLEYPVFSPLFEKRMWTLPSVLEHYAHTKGDQPFIRMGGSDTWLSFGEVNRRANRIARALAGLGVRAGDRVALMMPNCLEFIAAWFGASKAGAVEVPLNTAYKGAYLEHQLNQCEARIIVIGEEQLALLEPSLGALRNLETVVVQRSAPTAGGLPVLGKLRVLGFESLEHTDDSNVDVPVTFRDLAAILFTSGTTGLSKGVMMPHAQFYFFAEQGIQLVQLKEDDVYMTCLPLFHGNAQFLTVYPALIRGARCVLYERFTATGWIDQLHESGATVTNTIGVMLPFAYRQPPTPRDATHKVRRVLATPTPYELESQIRQRFGIQAFADAFGQTEICAPIMTPLGASRPKGACGLLASQWFDLRIVDPETDEEVPVGEVGELLVRHKAPWTLNVGYAGMPDKTLETYRNLWFHTGDAMRRDDQGWYFFVDRIKDALRRRGENISSFEVEAPIRQHESVIDVAVVGVPADIDGGEDEVKACVVLRPGMTLTPEALIDWCIDRLPEFTVPRYIEFVDSLPKTPSEKVQKNKLRGEGVNARTWDRVAEGYRLPARRARAQGAA